MSANYEQVMRETANRLGIKSASHQLEKSIIDYCMNRVDEWTRQIGVPNTLTELTDLVSPLLRMTFEEIRSKDDLTHLLERIPPEKEIAMARLEAELNDEVDAVTLLRRSHEIWEQPFLAVINCIGRHEYRRYFSKWYEMVHCLLEGEQLKFAFRRTLVPSLRNAPEEILVDRVAAVLAFYSPNI